MQNWTALPIRDEIWLCHRSPVGTEPVRAIPSLGEDAAIVVGPEGHAAIFKDRELFVLGVEDDAARQLEVPDDLVGIHCAHFVGDVLYVGGASDWQDTSRLGWYDLSDPPPSWNPLPTPDVVGDPNGPIYELLQSGDRLFALDGAFTPKLAIVYDISDPHAPEYVDHVAIPSGLDDIPVAAGAGRKWLAILTTSRQVSGKVWKIGIFDRDNLDEVTTFYRHADHAEDLEMPVNVTMHEDLLLISHGLKGLGVIRIDDRQPTRFEQVPTVLPWAQSYAPVDRIEYHTPLGQGRIVEVQPTSDPHILYLTLKRGGRTWWEEIEIR